MKKLEVRKKEHLREHVKRKHKKKKKEDGGVGFGCNISRQCLHRVTQQAGARLGNQFFSFAFQNKIVPFFS